MRPLAPALALALALGLPTVAALDAMPDASSWGATEARVIVRAAPNATLRVSADAPLLVGLTNGSLVPAPTRVVLPENASWHGLPGVAEIELRRGDAGRALQVELDDGTPGGASFTWPAMEHRAPGLGVAGTGLAIALAVGGRRGPRWSQQPPNCSTDRGRSRDDGPSS